MGGWRLGEGGPEPPLDSPLIKNQFTHMQYLHYVEPKLNELAHVLYGPRRDKTCLRGFRPSEFQTSHLSYSDKLEN